MTRWILLLAVVAVLPQHALARQNLDLKASCHLDQSLGPDFKGHDTRTLAKSLDALPLSKDQFETQAEYQRRTQAAVADVGTKDLCVVPLDEDMDKAEYDAESQSLWVPIEPIIGVLSRPDSVSYKWVKSAVWNEKTFREPMTNAFGAEIAVTSKTSEAAGVGFDYDAIGTWMLKRLEYHGFAGSAIRQKAIGVPIPANIARSLVDHVRVVFKYELAAPYRVDESFGGAATMDLPVRFAEQQTVVVGTLKGIGLFDDRTGEVLKVVEVQADEKERN